MVDLPLPFLPSRATVLRIETEGKIGQDGLAHVITNAGPVHGDERRRGRGCFWDANWGDKFIGGHFDARHLGQHLHAALRLCRLGRRRLEAIDELLHVRAGSLLLFCKCQVVGPCRRAGGNEGVIATGVEF